MSYIHIRHHGPYTLYSYVQSAYEIEAPERTVWLFGEDAASLYTALRKAERAGTPAEQVIDWYLIEIDREKESSVHPL